MSLKHQTQNFAPFLKLLLIDQNCPNTKSLLMQILAPDQSCWLQWINLFWKLSNQITYSGNCCPGHFFSKLSSWTNSSQIVLPDHLLLYYICTFLFCKLSWMESRLWITFFAFCGTRYFCSIGVMILHPSQATLFWNWEITLLSEDPDLLKWSYDFVDWNSVSNI